MVMLDLEFMASTFKYVLSAIPMTLMLTLVPLVLGLVIGVSLFLFQELSPDSPDFFVLLRNPKVYQYRVLWRRKKDHHGQYQQCGSVSFYNDFVCLSLSRGDNERRAPKC